jgi:hypothetical protein
LRNCDKKPIKVCPSMSRSLRERLALISGVDLEQLDGLASDEREEMEEFEPNLARLVRKP